MDRLFIISLCLAFISVLGQNCPSNPNEVCTGCAGNYNSPVLTETEVSSGENSCDVTLEWPYVDEGMTSPRMTFTCSYSDGSLCSGSEVDLCASCGTVTFTNLLIDQSPFIVYSDTCGFIGTRRVAANCQGTTMPQTTSSSGGETTTTSGGVTCSGVFEEIGGKCLFVDPFIQASWDEARFFCQEFGADLVVLNEDDIFLAVLDHLVTNALEHRSYWIGAGDRFVEGSWRWVNNEVMEMGTPYWAVYAEDADNYVQEPTNQGQEDFDCVNMDSTRYLYFADDDCREVKAAICEKTQDIA